MAPIKLAQIFFSRGSSWSFNNTLWSNTLKLVQPCLTHFGKVLVVSQLSKRTRQDSGVDCWQSSFFSHLIVKTCQSCIKSWGLAVSILFRSPCFLLPARLPLTLEDVFYSILNLVLYQLFLLLPVTFDTESCYILLWPYSSTFLIDCKSIVKCPSLQEWVLRGSEFNKCFGCTDFQEQAPREQHLSTKRVNFSRNAKAHNLI